MKRLAALGLLAGCLSEPALPPGHDPEVRKETLVADLDNDGRDELVMWGHSADPRDEADVFIWWGGRAPTGAPDLTVPISIDPDARWHEILAATRVQSTRDSAPPFLLVLSGEDFALPAAGIPTRRVYQTALFFAGHQVSKQITSPDFVSASNLGGYAGGETFAFVAAHDTHAGGQIHALHGSDSVFFDHGLPLDTSTAKFQETKLTSRDDGEKVQGVYTLPPTAEGHEDFLVATDHRVAMTDGDAGSYSFEAQHALPPTTQRISRGRTFGTVATWEAGATSDGVTVPLVRIAPGNSFAIEYAEFEAMHPAQDLGLLHFAGHSDIDVVDLEGADLAAYENVSMTTGQHDPRISTDAQAHDILVVGHFVDGEDLILLFDSKHPLAPPLCFSGPALAPC